MGNMKKRLAAILLAVIITVSFGVPAFADATQLALSSTKVGVKVGESTTLSALEWGTPISGVQWSSDNPAIAAVSNGQVTGVSLGRATVTATTADGTKASCVVHVAKKGIDVSYYQGTISWSDVKNSGVDFAIVRAGYGSQLIDTQTDVNFASNYDGAVASGIKVGAYYMSYAVSTDEAVAEAQMCLSIINARHLDYPIFIDIEQQIHRNMPKEQLSAIAAAFCKAITDTGYQAGIYAPTSIFNTGLSGSGLDSYVKWPAHWSVNTADYSNPYSLWQYGSGTVPGISGQVDLDYAYQDFSDGKPVAAQPAAPSAPAQADSQLISDTATALTMKMGKTYQFKFTPNGVTSGFSFFSANSGTFKVISRKKIGNSYYVKVQAVKSGSAGLYSAVSGKKAVRRCVVTVQ